MRPVEKNSKVTVSEAPLAENAKTRVCEFDDKNYLGTNGCEGVLTCNQHHVYGSPEKGAMSKSALIECVIDSEEDFGTWKVVDSAGKRPVWPIEGCVEGCLERSDCTTGNECRECNEGFKCQEMTCKNPTDHTVVFADNRTSEDFTRMAHVTVIAIKGYVFLSVSTVVSNRVRTAMLFL